jgi:hypothetical protein
MIFKTKINNDLLKGKTDVHKRFQLFKIYASLLHNDS